MIRFQVRQRIAALLADDPALTNVSVSASFPGDKGAQAQMLYGGPTRGTIDTPYAQAGTKIRRDEFETSFLAVVSGLKTSDECAERCQEIVHNAIEVIAATGLNLDEYAVNGEEVTLVGPFTVNTFDGVSDQGAPLARLELTIAVETQTI